VDNHLTSYSTEATADSTQAAVLQELTGWQHLPQWHQLDQWWQQQDQARLSQLHADLQHQLRENGATFDPWLEQQRQLDLMPWLVSDSQWLELQAGVLQRQRLLAAVLQDLYGPQLLLQRGVLPSDLLFLNKDYLLPCHGLVSQSHHWLPLLAVDVGRNSKGQFCAYADQSQMPAGLGFVLEHRLAFNHCTTELNHKIRKSQLAGFFRHMQQLLHRGWHTAVPAQGALVGLLTHAKRDAAYFEHAFLANYLDIALIHGADLMFKDGRLWLKTLTGLQQVDTLMRYLPDASCDALELEQHGAGCAGLLQSIREKQLFCANTPGASLIESGALLPFMQEICRSLLQQDLILPSAPALWCGRPAQLQQYLAQPALYRLQNISTGERWNWAELDEEAKAQLLHRVQQQSSAFVAVELLPLSQVPCWSGPEQQQSQYGVLRLFGLLHDPQHGSVLPGALARLAAQPDTLQHSYQTGFVAKDVWVLTDREQAVSLLQSTQKRILLSRHSGLLPSRVADHLFWLGRYNERLNLLCRALRSTLPLVVLNEPSGVLHADAQLMVRFCLQINGCGLPDQALDQSALQQLLDRVIRPDQPGGLASVLKNLLFNAQSVREYFSEDTWFVLDKLQVALYQWPLDCNWQQPEAMLRLLDEVILLQTAIYGLNNETMSRTQTLRFMDLGQHLERSIQTVSLLQQVFVPAFGYAVTTDTPCSASLMESVLRMTDTLMTYRRRYKTELHPLAIIDLLLLDDSTPRSIGYQCARLAKQVQQLPKLGANTVALSREQRLTVELVSLLQLVDPETLFDDHLEAQPDLARLLQQLQQLLRQLSDSITLSYFNHADPSSSWQSF